MLINISTYASHDKTKKLLEYAGIHEPDQMDKITDYYANDEHAELYGYEEDGELIGIIGCKMSDGKTLQILHLVVDPAYRGLGYGRGMILELIPKKKPETIIAETEEEVVDFFRNIGFVISSIGEIYPGTERFRCEFHVNEEESDHD